MFEVTDAEEKRKAFGGLSEREIHLGGYDVITTSFYPRDGAAPREVTVFIATQRNDLYLGKENLDVMAMQIYSARGFAGPNSEYVTRTADYIREHIPEDKDSHLFGIDCRLRLLEQQTACLTSKIGDEEFYTPSSA